MLLLSSWGALILGIMCVYIHILALATLKHGVEFLIHFQQLCKTFSIHFSLLTLLISSFYDPLFRIFKNAPMALAGVAERIEC